MKTTPTPPLTATTHTAQGWNLRILWAESMRRHRALSIFGLLMWAALLPVLIAWGLDERTLRGVSVWAKPIKFLASTGLFALSTAWFIGLLPQARQHSRAVGVVAWTLIAAGGFEIFYITLMAALGQASHYNFSSPVHVALYSLMGLGATAMTATQPLLAWQIARHGRPDVPTVWRDAVVMGLVMTFVLGAGAGGLLGSMQPPAGAGLPGVGWHPAADLRPAHFLGMHAQQLFPLAGAVVAAIARSPVRLWLVVFTMAYVALWAWAVARGLDGAALTIPYAPPA